MSASATPSDAGASLSLVRALSQDASLQRLQPLTLQSLRRAARSLQVAIHSETVAHALTLYRYVRLQQKLMATRARYKRKAAARKLNIWIAAACSPQSTDLLRRMKRDAHRLFALFREPVDDDEWWPELLGEVAVAAGGGRTRHVLQALFLLDIHSSAIAELYNAAARLQLMRYYLLTKQSARQIEAELLQDGVIEAAPLSSPSSVSPSQQAVPVPLQLPEEEAKVSHGGTFQLRSVHSASCCRLKRTAN
jgi:hypothetical protein